MRHILDGISFDATLSHIQNGVELVVQKCREKVFESLALTGMGVAMLPVVHDWVATDFVPASSPGCESDKSGGYTFCELHSMADLSQLVGQLEDGRGGSELILDVSTVSDFDTTQLTGELQSALGDAYQVLYMQTSAGQLGIDLPQDSTWRVVLHTSGLLMFVVSGALVWVRRRTTAPGTPTLPAHEVVKDELIDEEFHLHRITEAVEMLPRGPEKEGLRTIQNDIDYCRIQGGVVTELTVTPPWNLRRTVNELLQKSNDLAANTSQQSNDALERMQASSEKMLDDLQEDLNNAGDSLDSAERVTGMLANMLESYENRRNEVIDALQDTSNIWRAHMLESLEFIMQAFSSIENTEGLAELTDLRVLSASGVREVPATLTKLTHLTADNVNKIPTTLTELEVLNAAHARVPIKDFPGLRHVFLLQPFYPDDQEYQSGYFDLDLLGDDRDAYVYTKGTLILLDEESADTSP